MNGQADSPMSEETLSAVKELDIAPILARFNDWYGSSDDIEPSGYGKADWSLRDPDETLSHCIVREDIPDLLAAVKRLTRARDLSLKGWQKALDAARDEMARADHAEDEIARPDFAWLRHVATWGRRRPGRGWHQSVTALIETLDATQAALDRVTDDSMAERLAQRCMSELSCWIDTREVDDPATTYCVEHDVWAPDGECEYARRVADFVLDVIRAIEGDDDE